MLDRIVSSWITDNFFGLVPLAIGLCLAVISMWLVGIKSDVGLEEWLGFAVCAVVGAAFFALSVCMFWLKRSLILLRNDYLVTYSLWGLVFYRKLYPKNDFQFIYVPKIDVDAQLNAYGQSALAAKFTTREQQSDDVGACWLISASDFNKRIKICLISAIGNLRMGLPYDTHESYLMAFFQLTCVHSYDEVAGLSGELSRPQASSPDASRSDAFKVLAATVISTSSRKPAASIAGQDPIAPLAKACDPNDATEASIANSKGKTPIGAKPKGTFKSMGDDDTVRLANYTGLYAGVTLLILLVALMLFGAIPSSGILLIPVFIAITQFRETITLTGENVEASVGFSFFALERTSMRIDQIAQIRTYITKAMGNNMVVLELLSDNEKAVRLPLGMTGGAGKTIGLSRLTMAEALWLSKKIKARMPASLKIKVIEESLWD